jgi:membrane-associated phospholipid phosphatase
MEEFLRSLMPWGADAIVWVQQFSNGALDALFKFATYLGKEYFYILSLPILYWCVDKYLGRAIAVIFLLSEYVNTFLKDTFNLPRPYDYDGRIRAPLPETSPSFPSSHSQGSLVFWGGLASLVKRSWMWVVSVVLILLISLSRIYLGVHFPQDVLGGWIIGLILLALYLWVRRVLHGIILSFPVQLGFALAVPLLLFLLHPSESAGMVMGVAFGMLPGFVLEAKFVRFSAGGVWWKRIVRFVVGVIPLLALYVGLKVVFPEGEAFRFLRYALIGLWAGVVAPWVFVALRLAERERERARV